MTDRHIGYIVTLEHDIREDDAAATIAALRQIRGVLNVTPVVSDAHVEMIAERRARSKFLGSLDKLAAEIVKS